MNFKKKFDHDNILSYLPDNFTMGSSDYFDKKFRSRLPSYLCDILEIKTRKEYSNEDENEILIKQIIDSQKEFNLKLERELQDRGCGCSSCDIIEEVQIDNQLPNAK